MAKRVIAITAILCMVLLLTSCNKQNTTNVTNDTDSENETTHSQVEIDTTNDEADLQKALLKIKENDLVQYVNMVPGMRSNLDTEYEYSQYSELNDNNKYEASRNYNIRCVPNENNNTVHDDFVLNAHIEYKGDNEYPSSISIMYTFTSMNDHRVGTSWVYDLIRVMINKDTGDQMENLAFGSNFKVEDEDTGITTVCSKELDNESGETVEISENSESENVIRALYNINCYNNIGEYYYSDINTFQTNINKNFGLYELGIMSHGENISNTEKRIAGMFDGVNNTANIKIISDYHKENSSELTDQAYINADITVHDLDTTSHTGNLVVMTTRNINGLDENKTDESFKITFKSFDRDNEDDVYKDIDAIASSIFVFDDLFESNEITIEETKLNNDFGIPAKLTYEITNDDGKYYAAVVIESIEPENNVE